MDSQEDLSGSQIPPIPMDEFAGAPLPEPPGGIDSRNEDPGDIPAPLMDDLFPETDVIPAPPPQSLGKRKTTRRKRASEPSISTETSGLPGMPVRKLPYSVEAEQGVLGCIILMPRENMSKLGSKFKGKDDIENIFYDLRNQTILKEMLEMTALNIPIDTLTLVQHLKDKQILDAAGGIAYISSLQDMTPSVLNIDYYLNIVREKYLLRSLVQICTSLSEDVFTGSERVETLLDRAEKEVLRINGEWGTSSTQDMESLVRESVQMIESFMQRKGELTGLATGFVDLDKLTSGLHGGEMIVIAARPSMGKTSLAMNIAEHVALELNKGVGIFSLEMTALSLVTRMLSSRAHLDMQKIRSGFVDAATLQSMGTECGRLAKAPIYIDDTPGLSILNLRSRARRMAENGIQLFVIDYLQLLHSTSARADNNRQQEIAEISAGIKGLAKELNVPVIVLSQLNRDVEKDKNRPPRLSDLRESGAIEQDADLVMLIYRPENKDKKKKHGDDGEDAVESTAPMGVEENVAVQLIIAKQRNGPTGSVDLIFRKSYTRFENAARVDMSES